VAVNSGLSLIRCRSDAGVLGPWWASWSPLVKMAVWSDAVSWTRTSRSKKSKPRKQGWLGATGIGLYLQVFDNDHGRCGGREATSGARIVSWFGALLARVKVEECGF
jgi:hypothetical protein